MDSDTFWVLVVAVFVGYMLYTDYKQTRTNRHNSNLKRTITRKRNADEVWDKTWQ